MYINLSRRFTGLIETVATSEPKPAHITLDGTLSHHLKRIANEVIILRLPSIIMDCDEFNSVHMRLKDTYFSVVARAGDSFTIMHSRELDIDTAIVFKSYCDSFIAEYGSK